MSLSEDQSTCRLAAALVMPLAYQTCNTMQTGDTFPHPRDERHNQFSLNSTLGGARSERKFGWHAMLLTPPMMRNARGKLN